MRKSEVVMFEKIKVKRKDKVSPKRDDWKRNRKAMRKAKQETQEKWYA